MTVNSIDAERLRKLLGRSDLANLRLRLRARYERGASRDEFTLTELKGHERRALAGLLGRRTLAADSMRTRQSELDAALAHAGIAVTLREALEFLDGPLSDRRADRAARAQLAAEVLGDSHGLDNGRAVATLVLRARATRHSIDAVEAAGLQDAEESVHERWARLGVTVNALALPALCLNLPASGREVRPYAPPGEPVHLSLRNLLRRPPTCAVHQRDVFVCENPNIVAIAADRLGAVCAPLVCTDGMPAAAQQTLLSQLAAAGATLRYHGDFDWAGVTIGNFVMREFGAKPWRFAMQNYLSAAAGRSIPLRENSVAARWDDRLAAAMLDKRIVVHEEAVVETLLLDLAARA